MSEKTEIAWCDSTINFWRGCDKVSDGCKHCYITSTIPFRTTGQKHGDPRVWSESAVHTAIALNKKPWICDFCGVGHQVSQAHACLGLIRAGAEDLRYHRRRIFSLSLGDWLDDQVPIDWLVKMLDTIRRCPDVTWMLCSKRWQLFHKRMKAALWHAEQLTEDDEGDSEDLPATELGNWIHDWLSGYRRPQNVIGLCSVESQELAEKRIDTFLEVPLVCHGLSLEPLLGPVELDKWLWKLPKPVCPNCPQDVDCECGYKTAKANGHKSIDWLICGGESSQRNEPARECYMEWLDQIVKQGAAADVPVFVKQLGSFALSYNVNMFDLPETAHLEGIGTGVAQARYITTHKKAGDFAEFPDQLKVRAFPEGF